MPAVQTAPRTRPGSKSKAGGDFALAQLSDGRLIVGTAPFTHSATPAPGGVSFYVNDFQLSNSKPWRIPASWDELDSARELAVATAQSSSPPDEFTRSLRAIGRSESEIGRTLRVSLGWTTSNEQIERAASLIASAFDS